ncbi:hypothetical protein HanXRQr2_Chr14g0668181 [Helianthus annuus]|uniref:Uncharacterized protein n=1 Tax=Helianthus annuus TaxID=4232 RepID=A0A251SMV4_HELAN|nr:hypothetical protein HanXRQr2_Chr14g0668181 [Helianthus annuus]
MQFKIVFSRRKCWTELLVLQILLVFAGHDDVSANVMFQAILLMVGSSGDCGGDGGGWRRVMVGGG